MLPSKQLTAQLARVVRARFYSDTAYFVLPVPSGIYDEYGNAIVTQSEVHVTCSFTDKPSRESWHDYADIENIDAEIRVTDIIPTKGYRVKLAARFENDAYADKEYEIIGIQDRAIFGYLCALKSVTVCFNPRSQ